LKCYSQNNLDSGTLDLLGQLGLHYLRKLPHSFLSLLYLLLGFLDLLGEFPVLLLEGGYLISGLVYKARVGEQLLHHSLGSLLRLGAKNN
jgi:hypothetical protein